MDRLSQWVGHAFAWCVVILTLGISYEVVVRYASGRRMCVGTGVGGQMAGKVRLAVVRWVSCLAWLLIAGASRADV